MVTLVWFLVYGCRLRAVVARVPVTRSSAITLFSTVLFWLVLLLQFLVAFCVCHRLHFTFCTTQLRLHVCTRTFGYARYATRFTGWFTHTYGCSLLHTWLYVRTCRLPVTRSPRTRLHTFATRYTTTLRTHARACAHTARTHAFTTRTTYTLRLRTGYVWFVTFAHLDAVYRSSHGYLPRSGAVYHTATTHATARSRLFCYVRAHPRSAVACVTTGFCRLRLHLHLHTGSRLVAAHIHTVCWFVLISARSHTTVTHTVLLPQFHLVHVTHGLPHSLLVAVTVYADFTGWFTLHLYTFGSACGLRLLHAVVAHRFVFVAVCDTVYRLPFVYTRFAHTHTRLPGYHGSYATYCVTRLHCLPAARVTHTPGSAFGLRTICSSRTCHHCHGLPFLPVIRFTHTVRTLVHTVLRLPFPYTRLPRFYAFCVLGYRGYRLVRGYTHRCATLHYALLRTVCCGCGSYHRGCRSVTHAAALYYVHVTVLLVVATFATGSRCTFAVRILDSAWLHRTVRTHFTHAVTHLVYTPYHAVPHRFTHCYLRLPRGSYTHYTFAVTCRFGCLFNVAVAVPCPIYTPPAVVTYWFPCRITHTRYVAVAVACRLHVAVGCYGS